MKIIYPRVCGIDVHKQFIVAVICISESVEPIYLKILDFSQRLDPVQKLADSKRLSKCMHGIHW